MPHTLIDPSPPRVLFAELVDAARVRARVEPTPAATTYLVDLLDAQVRPAPLPRDADAVQETFTAGLLRARLERGGERLRQLRGLGDRALVTAGLFGDGLRRRPAGSGPCREAGRLAYGDLSAALSRQAVERVFCELFEELADRFGDFVTLLCEVADGTRASTPGGLDFLYARFLREGDERDRRRLLRRGHPVPPRSGGRLQ